MKSSLIFIGLLFSLTTFSQEKRLALVIGNSAYEHGGVLKNPVNDAYAMKQVLSQVGFEVMVYYNLNQGDLKRAIDDFGMKLQDYDVGLFFYAGHGIQARGYNYLIPIEANLVSENDVEYDCIDAGRVLGKMEDADNRTNIIILDACRNNPFERSWTRSTQGRGLTSMDPPIGSILAYATAPGTTASDGTGQNGLYTSALIEFIAKPGLTIENVFKNVRAAVINQSNGTQTPWESTSLLGEFYFKKSNGDTEMESSQEVIAPNPVIVSDVVVTATGGLFVDKRDNQNYKWVRIGEQIWMAENLNHYTSTGSWCYNNINTNCTIYGRLYDWKTALSVCPNGWHLPSDEEWKILTNNLGGLRIAGNKLKEAGTAHWSSQNTTASNSSGFTALPGGYRNDYGTFNFIGNYGYWWSSSETNTINAWNRYLYYGNANGSRTNTSKSNGFSVRCIKD